MFRVLSAETFSTLSTLLDAGLAPDRERLERLWRNLLLTDEHTWHADQSVRVRTANRASGGGAKTPAPTGPAID
jgi:hypothetical protein